MAYLKVLDNHIVKLALLAFEVLGEAVSLFRRPNSRTNMVSGIE